MRRSRAAIVLVALTLLGTACSGDNKKEASGTVQDVEDPTPVGPQTYTVEMDASSPDGLNLQAAVFFPVRLSVRPGDTVVFENHSTQAPHTVAFEPPREGNPDAAKPFSPTTKAGLVNPLVFGPCYTANRPPSDAEACPEAPPTSPPPYAGTGFWSSGALAPMIEPSGAPHSITLIVAPDTAPKVYSYLDLLHPSMAGLLDVVETDEERDFPAEVAKRAKRQRSVIVDGGSALAAPLFAGADGVMVAAGWGDDTVALNRFSPAVTSVKVGQTVTWKTSSPYEPHTLTFESPFKTPEDAGVFTPGGVKTGGRYAGGFAHSGLIGPQPSPSETFSLVFTKPGTYSYICVLHPGMAGQVEVSG